MPLGSPDHAGPCHGHGHRRRGAPGVAQARPVPSGYWLAGADGGVFSYGAPFYGSGVPEPGVPAPCAITPQPPSTLNASQGCASIGGVADGSGYWLLNLARQPTPFGGAGFRVPQPDAPR